MPIGWVDISANDPKVLRDFYREAFDWKFNYDEANDYTIIEPPEGGIGGGIGKATDPSQQGIVGYVNVTDAREQLEKIKQLGGEVVMEPYEVPGYGTMALVLDPEGNKIGLWQQVG